jgi:alcohol dehydrogenase (cytochrome c)
LLADVPVTDGTTLKLALEADRHGFAYAIDRTNGKFLWGLPFVNKVTWTKGIDPETGKPAEYDPKQPVQRYVASVTPSREHKVADICPGNIGGKNWPPTAYNPELKLWYIPVIESCNRITVEEADPAKLKAREFWTGGGPSQPVKITGSVTAIDVTKGKIAGKYEMPFPKSGRYPGHARSRLLTRTAKIRSAHHCELSIARAKILAARSATAPSTRSGRTVT